MPQQTPQRKIELLDRTIAALGRERESQKPRNFCKFEWQRKRLKNLRTTENKLKAKHGSRIRGCCKGRDQEAALGEFARGLEQERYLGANKC